MAPMVRVVPGKELDPKKGLDAASYVKRKPLEMTIDQVREYIQNELESNTRMGVPVAGIASMLAYWMEGHINAGTKVVR